MLACATYPGPLNIRVTFAHHPTLVAWSVFAVYDVPLNFVITRLIVHRFARARS